MLTGIATASPTPGPARSGGGPVAPLAFEARQGTPGMGTAVAQPGPEECRVEPRTIDDRRRLNVDTAKAAETVVADGAGGAVAAGLAPFNPNTPVPAPGQPADAEAVAGVNARLRELPARGVAGRQPRLSVLLTDDNFVRTLTL